MFVSPRSSVESTKTPASVTVYGCVCVWCLCGLFVCLLFFGFIYLWCVCVCVCVRARVVVFELGSTTCVEHKEHRTGPSKLSRLRVNYCLPLKYFFPDCHLRVFVVVFVCCCCFLFVCCCFSFFFGFCCCFGLCFFLGGTRTLRAK